MSLEKISSQKVFSGFHQQYNHQSSVLSCLMRFAVYLPPQSETKKVPVVYWLSGLTCTDENFMQKAGALRIAAELGIAIIAPDTSPRGDNVPDDPEQSYDLGKGAGFYVNATQEPWQKNYQMYDYVVDELPRLIEANFPVTTQRAISGHSMGGHGALVIGLRNTHLYSSITAFSPICSAINCPWGEKALTTYLGADKTQWQQYDAAMLVASATEKLPIYVDQGTKDDFLVDQLKPELLIAAAEKNSYPLTYQAQDGYDHSYYFIASFIEEHLRFHAKYLTL